MSTSALTRLRELVDLGADNENDCRDALVPFANVLVRDGSLKLKETEKRDVAGRIDLSLITSPVALDLPDQEVRPFRRMHVFEMKSPKKIVFTFDRRTKRYLPSMELVKAETQLLSYVHSLRKDMYRMLEEHRVKDVIPGGIVIGRNESMFGDSPEAAGDSSSRTDALESRCLLLYEPCRIALYTWDQVLQLIEERDLPDTL